MNQRFGTSRGRSSRVAGVLLGFTLLIACTESPAGESTDGGSAGQTTQSPAAEGSATPTLASRIMRGRQLVIQQGCGDCHGGFGNPAADGWLAGQMTPQQEFPIGPFITRARNLTPDNETGLGRFTERQIFNAIRYGLRPGETPDVEITSTVPGQGNFPLIPKYLAPPMPWPAFRHLPDEDILAIAAYLKNAVRPVINRVQDSQGPPDFWASEYTAEKYGPYPPPPFPTAREVTAP